MSDQGVAVLWHKRLGPAEAVVFLGEVIVVVLALMGGREERLGEAMLGYEALLGNVHHLSPDLRCKTISERDITRKRTYALRQLRERPNGNER